MTDCIECGDKGCPACTLPDFVHFSGSIRSAKLPKLELPEYSEWRLYLYGSKPGNSWSSHMPIVKGNVPNFFVRWMMKSIGCTWVKEIKHES